METHFADDATLKRLAELERINADLLAICIEVDGALPFVTDAELPENSPRARLRAAIAKARAA